MSWKNLVPFALHTLRKNTTWEPKVVNIFRIRRHSHKSSYMICIRKGLTSVLKCIHGMETCLNSYIWVEYYYVCTWWRYPNPDPMTRPGLYRKRIFFFSIPSPKNPTWTHGSILKDIYEIPYYSIIEESPRITYIFVQKNTY